MRLTACLFFLAMVPALRAADEPKAVPDGWKEYRDKERAYTVQFPEKPLPSENNQTLFASSIHLRFNSATVEPKDGPTFRAQTIALPLNLSKELPADKRLELFRDVYVKQVKGKLKEDKDIELDKIPGKELLIETGSGQVRLRMFADEPPIARIYQVSVDGTKEQVEAKETETFLKSLKILRPGRRRP